MFYVSYHLWRVWIPHSFNLHQIQFWTQRKYFITFVTQSQWNLNEMYHTITQPYIDYNLFTSFHGPTQFHLNFWNLLNWNINYYTNTINSLALVKCDIFRFPGIQIFKAIRFRKQRNYYPRTLSSQLFFSPG